MEASVGFNYIYFIKGKRFCRSVSCIYVLMCVFFCCCCCCRTQRTQKSCQGMPNKRQQASLSGIRNGSSGSMHLGTALREGKETRKVRFKGLIWSCWTQLGQDFNPSYLTLVKFPDSEQNGEMLQSSEIEKPLCTRVKNTHISSTVRVNDSSVIYPPFYLTWFTVLISQILLAWPSTSSHCQTLHYFS